MEKEFLEILNTHRPLLFKVCHLYCDQSEDREDLFQEVVLQLWKSYKGFRHEAKVSTWMYRVALNTAITYFKKSKKEISSLSSWPGHEIPDFLDHTELSDQMSQLYQAISQLDKIDKSVILLYLEEKSYEEISEVTGLSHSNVGVRINRIKTKLSNLINK
jgi:RNA polymerase sigma factor (sigma-70 family)